jgi:hypothetical protein
MPCEKNSQVDGTLLPQESRTLLSNQLVNEVSSQYQAISNNLIEKKPGDLLGFFFCSYNFL